VLGEPLPGASPQARGSPDAFALALRPHSLPLRSFRSKAYRHRFFLHRGPLWSVSGIEARCPPPCQGRALFRLCRLNSSPDRANSPGAALEQQREPSVRDASRCEVCGRLTLVLATASRRKAASSWAWLFWMIHVSVSDRSKAACLACSSFPPQLRNPSLERQVLALAASLRNLLTRIPLITSPRRSERRSISSLISSAFSMVFSTAASGA